MSMQVELREQAVYPWYRVGQTCLRGYLFHEGRQYAAAELAGLLDSLPVDAVAPFLARANGTFCVICQGPHGTWAAVDRMRGLPLFYGQSGDQLYISDDPAWVVRQVGSVEITPLARDEYMATGYVAGPHTLYERVRQLQGGEFMVAGDGTSAPLATTAHYYRFRPATDSSELSGLSAEDLLERHDVVAEGVIRRLVESAGGRTLVVPLSGGFDSRLICLLLRRLGYEDVVCYTYGRRGNDEARVSAEVARQVGYRWVMVPYSEERWQTWSQTPEWSAYLAAAENAVALPHIQDWPAVWELRDTGAIPRDSVFVPGHSGDFLGGSHIQRRFLGCSEVGQKRVIEEIFAHHYCLLGRGMFPGSRWKDFGREVREVLGDVPTQTPAEAVSACDLWNWQERQCKFICNSVRVYEFWGYEWRIPLWDAKLMDFWAAVPLAHRVGNLLYNAYVQRVERQRGMQHLQRGDAVYVEQPVRKLVRSVVAAMPAVVHHSIELVRARMRVARWRDHYHGHPMAWYGILSPDEFRSVYRSGSENINSAMAMRRFGS